MKKTYSIISHTHWDREWYQPFELFRYRLVDMIDNLIDIMKKYPDYRFHLDAQTIVLEDYLEIRPENEKILKKLIRSGRLLVGPWYVQNDFNLTSGEATVRNLIIGQRIAEDFGKCTRVAYMADQFGLVSQLPQIFTQLGMDSCIFGRGANAPSTPPQFYWRGADGSTVLCEFMKWWYNNLQRLPSNTDEALKLINKKTAAMEPVMKTHNYLLMNGVDHLEAQEDLLPILDSVRPMLSEDTELIQDTMPEFIERTKAELKESGAALPELCGELRIGGEKTVLTGTLSSRVYLKVANVRAEVALEKRVEPLYALLSAFKIAEPTRGYTDHLWKLLVKNHPHDSICGCSVDAVHRHMMDRYERIAENTDELIRRGMQAFSDHADRKGLNESDYLLTVFNSVNFEGRTVMDAEVMIPDSDGVTAFRLLNAGGRDVSFKVYSIDHRGYTSISPINLPGDVPVTRYRIRFVLPVSGVGFKTLTVRPCPGKLTVAFNEKARVRIMENDLVRCDIQKNGTLNVTDKRTGRCYRGLMLIEDTEEAGDEYMHRESENADVFTSEALAAKVSIIEDDRFMQRRRITYTLNTFRDGEKELPFDIELSLSSESPVIDVKMKFTNTAKDHRVRVLFPTDITSDGVYAAAPFDCVKHGLYADDNDRRRPNSGYFAVTDGKNGFAVLNEGLYEYEHKNDSRSTLALTLLRANEMVEWSRNKSTVPNEWHSPEAQCLGLNEAHFGICPFEGSVESGNVFALSELFLAPPISHSAPVDMRKLLSGRPFVQSTDIGGCIFFREPKNSDITLKRDCRLVKLIGDDSNRAVISACKDPEKGTGTVIRLYNPTEDTVELTLAFHKRIRRALRMSPDERTVLEDGLKTNGKRMPLTLKPKEIITLLLR